jgi:hypothetical protein
MTGRRMCAKYPHAGNFVNRRLWLPLIMPGCRQSRARICDRRRGTGAAFDSFRFDRSHVFSTLAVATTCRRVSYGPRVRQSCGVRYDNC